MEQWKELPQSNGRYEVSDCGRVRSYFYHKQLHTEPLLKKPYLSNVGYPTVALSLEGKQRNYSVHRLVMLTFVGESRLTVNHKDGNKLNNHLDNLEYITHRANIQHSFDTKQRIAAKGEKASNAKLTDKQIDWLRRLALEGKSNRDLVEIFNVSFNHVSNLKMGHVR